VAEIVAGHRRGVAPPLHISIIPTVARLARPLRLLP